MTPTPRCCNCSATKEEHGAGGECPGLAGDVGLKYATLQLPEGATCGQCSSFSYCRQVIACRPEYTMCDWNPIRFERRREAS